MPKKSAQLDIFEEFFSFDKTLLERSFYLFGIFATLLVFLSLFTFFLYFLAESTEPPVLVKIENTTDSSITITWTTNQLTKGLVIYTPAKTPKILRPIALLSLPINNRVYDQNQTLSTFHSVTLTNLYPNTPYLYRISTGLHTYKIDANGKLLPAIKTAP